MKPLILFGVAALFTANSKLIASENTVQDVYFVSLTYVMERVITEYREVLKTILEDTENLTTQDCRALENGVEIFQKCLLMVNEPEVTPEIRELQRLYKVLLRERRALTTMLLGACHSRRLTADVDKHIENISTRIDRYSYQVDTEGKKHTEYFRQLSKDFTEKDQIEFEARFSKGLYEISEILRSAKSLQTNTK